MNCDLHNNAIMRKRTRIPGYVSSLIEAIQSIGRPSRCEAEDLMVISPQEEEEEEC